MTDDELIEKASRAANGAAFVALWQGSTAANNGDRSSADLALCGHLRFWCNSDPAWMDRLFRQSGLFRSKWDEPRGEKTYGQITIAKALESHSCGYEPGRQRPPNGDQLDTERLGQTAQPDTDDGPARQDPPHLTDLGNARRLVKRHGADLRHVHQWKSWYVYDARRWAEDKTAEVVRRVKETQGYLYSKVAEQLQALRGSGADDAAAAARRAEITKLLNHAIKWEDARAIARSLELAKSEHGIPLLPEEMDRDQYLLNVHNGTIDLRTGELRQHRRDDLITKLAPVTHDPAAKCPTWDSFLDRIMGGNRNLISYLQRVVGYGLTGSVAEQCLWFFHGQGANGKSTFLVTILAMLGDYAMQGVSDMLIEKKHESHPTERADLCGKRFVATIETEEGRRLAEALMKQMTGGDKVRARKVFKDFFEFHATHKIILAANHKPVIRGRDHAVWRRIKMVPFTVTISEQEKDKELPAKLKAELPGILNWALRGCLDWQAAGLGEPDEVKQATGDYQAEQDVVEKFIAECCHRLPEGRVKVSALYEAYGKWSGDKFTTLPALSSMLLAKGFEKKRTTHGYFWHGVGLDNQQYAEYTNERD